MEKTKYENYKVSWLCRAYKGCWRITGKNEVAPWARLNSSVHVSGPLHISSILRGVKGTLRNGGVNCRLDALMHKRYQDGKTHILLMSTDSYWLAAHCLTLSAEDSIKRCVIPSLLSKSIYHGTGERSGRRADRKDGMSNLVLCPLVSSTETILVMLFTKHTVD